MTTSAQARRWAKTGATQQRILDAATEVFATRGFTAATMADVVAGSGASIGSIYHHFGGKSELYVALWQEHQAAQEAAASKAVADAKRAGVTDPFELFSAGTRAFLEGSWQRRDLVMLFVSGDSPPGFEVMVRRRSHEWISQNNVLLKLSDTSFDRLYAVILTSLIGEGAREVIVAKNRRQANSVIDAVIEYVRRLMAGGPWNPSAGPVDDDKDEQMQGASGQGSAAPRRRAARRPASGRAVSKVAPAD